MRRRRIVVAGQLHHLTDQDLISGDEEGAIAIAVMDSDATRLATLILLCQRNTQTALPPLHHICCGSYKRKPCGEHSDPLLCDDRLRAADVRGQRRVGAVGGEPRQQWH